jgi:membrane-bound metal-dependent hydrolase YbcI (DUF457 family)
MDTLAHGLWTNAIFSRQQSRDKWWAIFFGIAPDALSFGPFVGWKLATNSFAFRMTPPDLVVAAYALTHSLVIFAFFFGLALWWRGGQPWWPLLAWGLHIVVDIFSHSYDYFPTPFLFPFSRFEVNSISWAEPTFMIANYTFLALVYFEIYRRQGKRSRA